MHSYDKKVKRNPLVKKLIKEIRDLDYQVIFVPSWRNLGVYDAYGMHERSLHVRKIWCVRYRKDGSRRSAAEVAHTLAHELRHAQHMAAGLYDAYYGRREAEGLADIGIAVAVGIRAERDCDRYARERLKAAGVYTPLLHRRYPLRKVAMYLEYRRCLLARQMIRALKNAQPTDKIEKEFEKIQRMIARDKR